MDLGPNLAIQKSEKSIVLNSQLFHLPENLLLDHQLYKILGGTLELPNKDKKVYLDSQDKK